MESPGNMHAFIYETNIPGLLNQLQVETRVSLWKQSNIKSVFIPVYRGIGATWPSSFLSKDPDIDYQQALGTIRYIRSNDIKVILVFDVIFNNTGNPIHQEWLIEPSYYDIWNKLFVKWRCDIVQECLSVFPCDAVGFDFIRSKVEQHPTSSEPSSEAVRSAIHALHSSAYPYPCISINHMKHAQNMKQGINVLQWMEEGAVQDLCLFNYETGWSDFPNLPYEKCWLLDINYVDTVNGPEPLSDTFINKRIHSIFQRHDKTKAYGLFTANMLTAHHASMLRVLP